MVDASSSVGEANLRIVMNFVTNIFHYFANSIGIRYGMVVFGDHAQVQSTN